MYTDRWPLRWHCPLCFQGCICETRCPRDWFSEGRRDGSISLHLKKEVYLFSSTSKAEWERAFYNYSFTPKMPAIARAGTAWSQEPDRTQVLEPSDLLLCGVCIYQEAGSEAGAGTQGTVILDANNNLTAAPNACLQDSFSAILPKCFLTIPLRVHTQPLTLQLLSHL